MDVSSLHNPTANPSRMLAAAAPARAEGFATLLRSAGAERTVDEQARQAAEQLVASALVTPMLSEIREEPLNAGLFHGGLAEDSFRQQMDGILADRIVKSERFPLVDRIYEQVMRRSRGAAGVDAHG